MAWCLCGLFMLIEWLALCIRHWHPSLHGASKCNNDIRCKQGATADAAPPRQSTDSGHFLKSATPPPRGSRPPRRFRQKLPRVSSPALETCVGRVQREAFQEGSLRLLEALQVEQRASLRRRRPLLSMLLRKATTGAAARCTGNALQ